MTDVQKVKMLTPEEQAQSIKKDHTGKSEMTITDPNGKKILLKKPNVLAQYRIVEILGDTSKNEVYMAMVMPLLYVEAIDGITVVINKKSELEALILRLADEGVSAVMLSVQENFMPKNAEDQKEQLKK